MRGKNECHVSIKDGVAGIDFSYGRTRTESRQDPIFSQEEIRIRVARRMIINKTQMKATT